MLSKHVKKLARDFIFGQMHMVIANISICVEAELKKIDLRIITDASGYFDALVQEAASDTIDNLKIDMITLWDSGNGADGKSSTASFLSGLAGSVPPLHKIAKNVGVELPQYLGKLDGAKHPSSPTKPSATDVNPG